MSSKINWKSLALALMVIIVTFFLTLLIDTYWVADAEGNESAWKVSILVFIGAIQTTALAVAIWDFIAKKSFVKEILDLAKLSNNISETGVLYIYDDFLSIDWSAILKRSNNLTIAVSYANTWRESHREYLRRISNIESNLTVFLPNFELEEVLKELSVRFDKTPEIIKESILQSYNAYKELGATVYLFNGCFQTSYYLMDNEAVMAVFNHKKEKSIVPAIQVNKLGSLYKYIAGELDAIKNNSKKG